MKRLGCLFSLSLFTIFISLSAPDSVASDLVSRPVGLLRIDLAPGEQRLTSTPFECLVEPGCPPRRSSDPHPVLNLPQGISILIWDTASAAYTNLTPDVCGLTPGSGTALAPHSFPNGAGFWLCNDGASTQTVYLSGSVILDETRSLTLPPSLSLIGYPFSTAIAFTNTELGRLFTSGALAGDSIYDPQLQLTENGQLLPGRGYWYNRASTEAVEIIEPRPYADVFPPAGGDLAITSIVATANGVSLGLAIPMECTAVDIFSKALTNGPASLDTGWTVLETVEVGRGRPAPPSSPLWSDICILPPDSPSSSRLYLLARADIDLDQNGIPDARERFVLGDGVPVPHSSESDAVLAVSSTEEEPMVDSVETSSSAATGGEVTVESAAPRSRIIYVDAHHGDDTCDGLSKSRDEQRGAKKTLAAGCAVAQSGQTIEIMSGRYQFVRLPAGVGMVCRGHVVFE